MRLVAMSGGQTLSFPLRQGATIIGRHASCHICIPSPTLSRRHCQCLVDGATVTLRDLGSSHGTFVNGQRVERAQLRDGDLLSLGGFQLRFEAGEGAAPGAYAPGAYAAPAGPVQDAVVTPQGAPPGAQGPAPPFGPEPPPPAPTDFPEPPSGDETPVDQSFMPAPYTPHKETVLGPATQPQLVVRDGRWFLRDPRTGRELEIAPRGAEGAIAAPPAELRRPNVRLLVTVVAIAAIVVIAFAAVILRKKDAGPIIVVPEAEYVRELDAGLDLLEKGDYKGALARFDAANRKRRDLEVGRYLSQYTMLLQAATGESGKLDFLKLDRGEAKRYLDSLLNTRCPSDKALAFAKTKLGWMDKEEVAFGLYEAAIARLRGSDSEEVRLDVLSALQQLPEDRTAAQLAKAKIAEIRRDIAKARLAAAERDQAQLKWADAIAKYQEALPFVADDALKAQIARQVEDCRRYVIEADLIKQARDDIRTKNYPSAEAALPRIKPGHYYAEAQRLLAEIKRSKEAADREALRQQVLDLYKRGSGPEAAKLADDNKLTEFAYIRERVKRIEDLLAAGRKAEDAKAWRDAEQAYQQAAGVETDADNDYARRAKAALDAFKARYPQIAAEILDGALRKLHAQPAEARKDLDEVLVYDANNERAKKLLATLDANAKLLYNEGRVHVMAGRPATAKPILERARDCSAPGSDLHKLILQELDKLEQLLR